MNQVKNEKPIKLVTHDGRFHPDDVFCYIVLSKVFPNHKLTRTRDPGTIERGDIVFDVGGEYDPKNGRFDHHQENPPMRSICSGYSAIGLIWNTFGEAYIKTILQEREKPKAGEHGPSQEGAQNTQGAPATDPGSDPGSDPKNPKSSHPHKIIKLAAAEIDAAIIACIDASDCGEKPWADGENIFRFNRTWLESENDLGTFQEAASIIGGWFADLTHHVVESTAKGIHPAFGVRLSRMRDIPQIKARVRAEAKARHGAIRILEKAAAKAASSNRPNVLELSHSSLPWMQIIHAIPGCENAEFIILQNPKGDWILQCVHPMGSPFIQKKPLPPAWRGKSNEDLAAASGVPDANFCHNKGFICGAKTKEGIYALLEGTLKYHTKKKSSRIKGDAEPAKS